MQGEEEQPAADRRFELEEFLGLLSHELRAPLTVISGYAQLLGRRLARGEMHAEEEYADLIKEQASRMSGMVSDLVELGRLEGGLRELQLSQVQLGEVACSVVRRVANEQRRSAAKHDISVQTEGERSVVCGDQRRLEQALSNLIGNALRYSPTGGKITVTVRTETNNGTGPQAVILVTDEGVGVPDDEKGLVFERGYRGRQGRTLSAQGLGLGLYICKLVAEAHGGTAGVEDGPGGKGSSFWLRFPAGQAGPEQDV
jgi:signal transduction histidine kinase